MPSESTAVPLRVGLTAHHIPPPNILVIFGATGDLTQRKLVPALFDLFCARGLSPLPPFVWQFRNTHSFRR